MIPPSLLAFLQDSGQTHLLAGIEALSSAQREAFFLQLQSYASILPEQRRQLFSSSSCQGAGPCTTWERSGDPEYQRLGEEWIRQGKVGCLILAGGQGSRLGLMGPKGMVPVTPLTNKSLFQLFAERIKNAQDEAGRDLPLCIMTSELNHEQTVLFFKEHQYFGLTPSEVSFFQQEQLPLIDAAGNWLLKAPGRLAEGPDGNGHALHLFFTSGLWQQWKAQGVEFVNLIFVDNALADPLDAAFVGFTVHTQLDVALKAVMRGSPEEAMGVVAEVAGQMRVIEYSELPSSLESFTLSSTGMFCVQMDFIEKLCLSSESRFPLHLAWKMAEVWDPEALEPCCVSRRVGKCERFLFDLLAFTRSSAAFVCPREQIYAPLKNASGDKSLETVKQALLRSHSALH